MESERGENFKNYSSTSWIGRKEFAKFDAEVGVDRYIAQLSQSSSAPKVTQS